MQLGTRWDLGAAPSPRLDAEVVAAIAAVEAAIPDEERVGRRWTLTWLEGRPVVELDGVADGPVTIVRYGWDGLEVVEED